jgi:iron(III) transport system permease protein
MTSSRMQPAGESFVGRLRNLTSLRFDPAMLLPLLAAALLIYLAAIPIVMLVLGSFQENVGVQPALTLDNYGAAYASRHTYSTFITSLVFALGSAVVSFVFGTLLAWLVERTDTPFRRVFLPLAIVPLILPGVLEVISWIFLFNPKVGYLNLPFQQLFGLKSGPIDIYSLPGMIWVQSVGQIPLAFLLMIAAFRSMDPSLEESATMSGANTFQMLRRITMRLIMPISASVLLLMFVRSLEAFEVPAIIGIPARTFVYTSEIYQAFTDFPPDYGRGSALAVGLLLLSIVGVWLYIRTTRNSERYQTVTGKAFRPKRFELGHWRWVAAAFLLVYFTFVVLMPFLVIFWVSFMPYFAPPSLQNLGLATLSNYQLLAGYDRFHSAAINSVILAVLAASVTVLITAVISWIVYRSKLPGRQALDFLAFLPIAIPGLVLGMGLIIFYVTFPVPIYGTIWVLLIAYTTKYLPYGMRSASGSIVQIHRELEEAGAMSGASWWQSFWYITMPLLRAGLVAGWIYIAIVSFREFSTSILLATGQSQVLSILVFTMFEQGQTTEVAAIGVFMIATILGIVGIFYRLTGRFGLQL